MPESQKSPTTTPTPSSGDGEHTPFDLPLPFSKDFQMTKAAEEAAEAEAMAKRYPGWAKEKQRRQEARMGRVSGESV